MKTLLPFLCSIFIPGTGQLYLGKYVAGLTFLLLPILIVFLFPNIPAEYPFVIFIIISVADIYFRTEKFAGRKKAVTYLFFSIIIAVVIIPSVFYLLFMSMHGGSQFITHQYFNKYILLKKWRKLKRL